MHQIFRGRLDSASRCLLLSMTIDIISFLIPLLFLLYVSNFLSTYKTRQSHLKCPRNIQGDTVELLDPMDQNTTSDAHSDQDSFFSGLVFLPEHAEIDDHHDEIRLLAHAGTLDDLYLDNISPPFQAIEEDVTQERSYALPSASLDILRRCRSKLSMVTGNKVDVLLSDPKQQVGPSSPLSTNNIIELAARNFIRSNSATTNEPSSAVSHPYSSSLLGLPTDIDRDVHLVQDLLLCAEKVGNQQYSFANKLLSECNKRSSSKKSTIQRLVHCFTEALMEKIDRKTGRFTGKGNFSVNLITPSSAAAALQRNLPITQVAQFTCVQAIMDHISSSAKVHIIDLEMHCGIMMIMLMQELASRSDHQIKHLKITAVETKSKKILIEEASLRLKDVAESLKINFSFNVVMLEDIINHRQNLFDCDAEEAVIVHATYALQYMISKPHQLEMLMRSIRSTNPRVMIITETESNVNSPIFVTRFVEALFFYGAYFDCMEDCMKNDAADRTLVESYIFSPTIRNVVAAEGEDRNVRSVSINIWRAFFARFGMVQMALSEAVIDQANLICTNMGFSDSCSLALQGNCLIIGWKRTPICSISAWKFHAKQSIRRFRI